MGESEKHVRPEREATDESLGVERSKTDEELARGQLDDERDADRAVANARDLADGAVDAARAHADTEIQGGEIAPRDPETVEEERSREDDASREARATADREVSSERDARRRALAALLTLEREQTDEQLLLERERADAAIDSRDDFLAMVSHDLRNMLGGVALSAALILDVPGHGAVHDDVTRHAQRIQRFAGRMNRLVGDLLDVVSIEAGRLAMVLEEQDASDLVREALELFQPAAAAKGITIRTDVKTPSLRTRYDHDRILQVFSNLLGNAIKFTPKGGKIDIVAERVDHELRFSIVDDGVGIAQDKLGTVFERFWQVARQDRAGLGLGLYISKAIVEAHNGRIWVDSHLHEGSTFHFTLPGPTATTTPA